MESPELNKLCVGKTLEQLQKVADWDFYSCGDDFDEYWREHDGFIKGLSKGGIENFFEINLSMVPDEDDDEIEYAVEQDEDDDSLSFSMIIIGTFEEVKAKLESLQ